MTGGEPLAQGGHHGAPGTLVRGHVDRLGREGWQALSSPHGAEHYDRQLTEDAIMVFPFGVLDRRQAIEAIAGAEPWSHFELTGSRVLQLTQDSGVISYHAHAERPGQAAASQAAASLWVSSVYVYRDGRWRMALHQQSFR